MKQIINKRKYMPIIKRNEVLKVDIEQILMIEQDCRKILIHTAEGVISQYKKIEDVKQYLDKRFYQCHRSCIINLDKVIHMREQTIFFESGLTIHMGRESFIRTKQFFARFIRFGILDI